MQNLLQQLDQATVEAKTSADEIKGLRAQIATFERRIENTPRREQEAAQITRDYESTRELFRSLLSKRGEAEMAADLEQRQQGEHFRIIDPATLPDRPAGPNRFRIVLITTVLAGICGFYEGPEFRAQPLVAASTAAEASSGPCGAHAMPLAPSSVRGRMRVPE